MKAILIFGFFLSLPICAFAENVPNAEFKRRWLNMIGCWENTKVGQYWCNAPVEGPNIRGSLLDFRGQIRLAEGKGPSELICMRLGAWKAQFNALGFLMEDVAKAEGVGKELQDRIGIATWQMLGDNTYLYWSSIESYCLPGRKSYRNKQLLLANLRKMRSEMLEEGRSDSIGVVDAIKRVNAYLEMEMPFDQGLDR